MKNFLKSNLFAYILANIILAVVMGIIYLIYFTHI